MADYSQDPLHPIAILVDELRSEDVTLRLNAIHRISTIALALGTERTRTELIPFLIESIDDDDEILLALAEELGLNFVEYVGGDQYAHLLLPVLEILASVEETLVREKASESISKVCAALSEQQIEEFYLPLLKRLESAEWFTSRTSATSLFAAAYPRAAPATRDDMRKMYTKLCTDDTPMVRRAAAKELGPFSKTVSHEHLLNDLLPAFRKLSQDDQDSVRCLTVDALIAIAEALSNDECKTYLGAPMKAMVSDKSWRVRYMVADHFVKLATAAGEDHVREDLVVAFVALLKDNEAEVRTAAAGQIPGFAKLVDREIILARLMPCIRDLSTDTSQHVRAALATQISGLAPLLGKDSTIEHLLPLFLHLLKDEFPDVRLNIISKLDMVNAVIGIELLSKALLPAIVQLAEDKQWRVRQAIIEYIPLLAQQLGVAFFDEQLASLCMNWLGDPVFSIREAATVNLRKLTEAFGVEWAKSAIIPQVINLGTNTNYLFRMTTVFAITVRRDRTDHVYRHLKSEKTDRELDVCLFSQTMAPALDVDVIRSSVLQTVTLLVSDRIPNIRFNVAKALETLAKAVAGQPGGKELVAEEILPSLEKLRNDTDADVRFFAEQASITAQNVANGETQPILTEVTMSDV
ncbi:BQ2448_677 [Microbotryum intermedium]|uniref:BQ2448_677 protein n=1 Tax=Microbotryum intermedium TaxID=269621 RepID=A0A238FBV7_9BASI|nr:BQ2448_677 [Microbotryum intermedium]